MVTTMTFVVTVVMIQINYHKNILLEMSMAH